jgi:anti-sigma factor RsiW
MAMSNDNDRQDRDAIDELLPWHATGTLSRRDAAEVEKALAADPEMARRFGLVCDELAETIHLNESLGAPSARAMEKLFAAIDAEGTPACRPKVAGGFAARITDLFAAFSPRSIAWASAAAAVVILLQAGVIGGVLLHEHGTELASVAETAPTAAGSYALVRFAPQASAADITAFLDSRKAAIVDGPRGGMYRVRVAEKTLSKEDLDRLVKAMQDDRAVVGFAVRAE